MSLAIIKQSVFAYLDGLAGLPPLYFDNIESEPPPGDHLRPFVLPANTSTIGIKTLNQEIGVIQVSVYTEKGKGEIIPANYAQLILDAFPRNTKLTGLRIDQAGSIAPAFYDGAWHITPVSVPYQNLID